MAGNEWINGYLEAILDSGASAIEENKQVSQVNVRDRGHFNPTKYFVEEVVTGVDETDLHRTWIKVVATRNTRERSSRLENMCWRIWHLTRKKKQILKICDLNLSSSPVCMVWSVEKIWSLVGILTGGQGGSIHRQVSSPEVDWSYGEPTEMLTAGPEDADAADVGESSGAYIIRIPFGPRDKYLNKELCGPIYKNLLMELWLTFLTYAGDSAALLSGALNVPMVLTGHSLGRNKLEQLLKQGRQSKEDINSTYKIMRRIEAEELSLDAAELVIPPGMDFSNVMVQEDNDVDGELTGLTNTDGASPKAIPPI
ncbi:hypothetical protein RJ639_015349 [Escallonia herrerae]|uniref:Sucrose phosphate synthase n=1 Tax=Escallonia herrerae TaxID=1293975 RepID=A0AA89AQ32_9ASTE|nr:hypothetical protein RJ639_015349 [Escallonia herrerae]